MDPDEKQRGTWMRRFKLAERLGEAERNMILIE